ncbi:hypothetical protein PA598K_06235 [Paenibacillus sp. 598K]|nr:hypothetical protein PA598K_06235 [Paenibacillus sp. 598K]
MFEDAKSAILFYKKNDGEVAGLFSEITGDKWKSQEQVILSLEGVDSLSWQYQSFDQNKYQVYMGIVADERITKVIYEENGERHDASLMEISEDTRLWLHVKDEPAPYQANYRIIGLDENGEEIITFG